MGASFYHAMGFTELVASSADEYVEISRRLGVDREYRHRCSTIIKHLSRVIWQRKEVREFLFVVVSTGTRKTLVCKA